MKALVIRILDAGIFKDPRISGSQDKMVDITGKQSRYVKESRYVKKSRYTPYIKIPAGKLGVKHVANLLRVLWGERPVPSIRKVHEVFKRDPYFEELAKKVRVKVLTPVISSGKEGKPDYYPEEVITVRKSIGDSWQTATKTYILDGAPVQVKGGLLYPDRLRRYIGDVLYKQFTELVDCFGGAPSSQGGIELLNKHKTDERVTTFCTACKNDKKTSLSNIIINEVSKGIDIHAKTTQPLNLLMASGTIDIIEKFDAVLYVPVTDEDLRRVDEGTGVATFLEGGFASVVGVEDWSELLEIDTQITVEGELCI